jgi:hypothetical protein
MSGFIDKTSNIDAAEIAAEYRTPDQGVSAKSNSNVTWNEYRKMTPRANQAVNTISTAGSQTLQARDFGGTAGMISHNQAVTSGTSKGASTVTYTGISSPTGSGSVFISGGFGNFGLGSSGGTSGISMTGVASFPSGSTLHALYMAHSGFGGTSYIEVSASNSNSGWTTMYLRSLYPGGSTTSGSNTFYNFTFTYPRSDFTYTYTSGKRQWSVYTGIGGNTTLTGFNILLNRPFTVEFV